MKTDYAGHERLYQQLRAEGEVGWNTEGVYSERITRYQQYLSEGFAPKGGSLLVLGCGAGNISLWLAGRGYTVTGVDISATAIDWANSKAAEVDLQATFKVGSVLDLDFEDASFDFVFDDICYHCIIGADRKLFLSEAARVLKPDGFLLVDSMCQPVNEADFEGYDPASRCAVLDGVATRHLAEAEDIKQELYNASFRIVSEALSVEDGNGNVMLQAVKADIRSITP